MSSDARRSGPFLAEGSLAASAGGGWHVETATMDDWSSIAEVLLFHGLPTQDVVRHLHHHLVARIDGVFAGTLGGCVADGSGRIVCLAVVPERQKQGVGTALVECMKMMARAHGAEKLTVVAPRSLRAYFARHGFRCSAPDDPADLLRLEIALSP